jgi:hypothetical protein
MQQPCPYCKVVNTVCFWGPRREAAWKRPVLFIIALAIAASCALLAWFSLVSGKSVLGLVSAAIAVFALLSTVVALNGCLSCVARLLGEA